MKHPGWLVTALLAAAALLTPAITSAITYDKALEAAFRDNPGLSISDLGIDESEESLVQARSGFHPSVKFSGSYTRLGTVPVMSFEIQPGFELEVPMGAADNYSAGFSVTVPIFVGGKRAWGVQMAELGVEAAAEEAVMSRAELHSQVTAAFFGLLLAEEAEKIARADLDRAEDQLKETEGRWKVGYASPLDLKQDQVAVSQAKAALLQAENSTLQAQQFLNMVLGRPVSDSIHAEGSFDISYKEFWVDTLVTRALKQRPEISALDRASQITRLSANMARSAYSPSLVFVGSPSWSNPSQTGSEGWDHTMAATLALEWPLYDGGKGFSEARVAEIQARKLDYSRSQAADGIELEVRQAYASWEEAYQQLLVQQTLGAQMVELASMASEQYKMGVISSLEYQSIMLSKTQVELARLASLYQLILAREELISAAWLWDEQTLEEFKTSAGEAGKEESQ